MKQASIALVVSCLLAGCGNATPTAAPPAPAGSPVAEVEASAPVVNGVQAPPNSGVPAPSASAAPQPTSTPGPDTVRMTAAAGFLAAGVANVRALNARPVTTKAAGDDGWISGQYAAALKQLQAPADAAADLHDLIRKVNRYRALKLEEAGHFARVADFYAVARHVRNTLVRVEAAAARVRAELRVPPLPLHLPLPFPPGFSYP